MFKKYNSLKAKEKTNEIEHNFSIIRCYQLSLYVLDEITDT